jgi:hypothetical protein
MAAIHFQPVKSNDQEMTLVQNALKRTLDSITRNPVVGGTLLRTVPIAAGSNLVNHGLGRNYITFFWGNPSASVSLSAGASPDPSKIINIVSSGPASLDLLVL